jgi:rhamnogalacturonyl hydrolase YesR
MKLSAAVAAALALAGLAAPLQARPRPAAPAEQPRATLDVLRRVADWQLQHLDDVAYVRTFQRDTADPTGWFQGAFWVGLTALADRDPAYARPIVERGRALGWRLGPRPYHADDQVIGRAWLWAAAHGHPEALDPTRTRFDAVLAAPPQVGLEFDRARNGGVSCEDRWCWADALFMAPPTWAELSKLTGDPKYLAWADKEWWATTDFLYDPVEHLYWRDSTYFGRRGPAGEKVFWSRGDGWVYAGLVQMLQTLPPGHPSRPRYETLYRQMSDRLVGLQRPDGYWPTSLEGRGETTPETSGTGFFTYGLAFGLNTGRLAGPRYRTAVARGWAALTAAVRPDGRLGWVQQVGAGPDQVFATDTQLYGAGAFLLAGSQVWDLERRQRGQASRP